MELNKNMGLRFKGFEFDYSEFNWAKDLIKGKVYTVFYEPLSVSGKEEFDYIIYDEVGRELDFGDNRKQYFKEV